MKRYLSHSAILFVVIVTFARILIGPMYALISLDVDRMRGIIGVVLHT